MRWCINFCLCFEVDAFVPVCLSWWLGSATCFEEIIRKHQDVLYSFFQSSTWILILFCFEQKELEKDWITLHSNALPSRMMPFSEELLLPKVTALRTLLLSVGRHNRSLSGWLSAEFIASKNTITFWAALNFLLISKCHFSARCFFFCGFFSLEKAGLFYHGSEAVMWCSCCCGDVEIVECTSMFYNRDENPAARILSVRYIKIESALQVHLCGRSCILMLVIFFDIATYSFHFWVHQRLYLYFHSNQKMPGLIGKMQPAWSKVFLLTSAAGNIWLCI